MTGDLEQAAFVGISYDGLKAVTVPYFGVQRRAGQQDRCTPQAKFSQGIGYHPLGRLMTSVLIQISVVARLMPAR